MPPSLRISLVLIMTGGAACRPDSLPPLEVSIQGPRLVPDRLNAQRLATMEDTLGMHLASDLLPHPDGYLVVDSGNDRLLVLSRDLQPQSVIGTSGSGPGELEAPMTGALTAGGVAVVELSNLRISLFDHDGDFQDVIRLPGGFGDLAVEPDGSMLIASGPPDVFLTRMGLDGTARPFAVRPRGSDTPHVNRGVGRADKVAVTRAGTVLVLDNTAGLLHAFERTGALRGTASLPGRILRKIQERNGALRESLERQGQRVLGIDLVKAMKTQPDGRILVLFTAGTDFGLLLDPETFRARLLGVPDREGPWDPLLRATSALIEGNEITVLHMSGVTRFRLVDES
jgi:hypothetical protein